MKKSIYIFSILCAICLLQSCATEECSTCSKDGEEDLTFCSDGSIIGDAALLSNIEVSEADGFSCN